MTFFDYLATGYVMILSFAILRAVSGIPFAVVSPGRYAIHLFWLVSALSFCLIAFWEFWGLRELEWTLSKFACVLVVPILIYGYTSLLVPPDPSHVKSWRDHFFRIRVPLFSTGIALNVSVIFNSQYLLAVPLLHPTLLMNELHVALNVIGVASARPKVHAALVFANLIYLPLYFLRMNLPDSLFGGGP